MDFTNFWIRKESEDFIQRYSLRFRGAQYLERTNVAPTYGQWCCLSFWYKDASYQGGSQVDSALINSALSWPPTSNDQISLRITDTSSFTDGRILAGQNNQIAAGGGRNDLNCTRAIRDYSGWYHIVFQINSNETDPVNRYRFWINGEPEQYNNPNDPPRQAEVNALNTGGSKTLLGSIIYGSGTQTYCNGYMADVHFVDGSLPGPNAFAEYNEDGVWVPKEYTGSYGNNGYYLNFDDPNDIGADVSGNGNHFSATGFGLNSSPTYSDTLYEGTGNFNYNVTDQNFKTDIQEAFDGSENSAAEAPEGNWIIWQNFGDYYNIGPVDSVTIRCITSQTWVNEGSLTDDTTSDLLRDLTFDLSTKGSPPLSSIAIKHPGGGGVRTSLAKVTIVQNGVEKVLIEGAGTDYDYMKDHPTSNYSTLNPLTPDSNVYSRANLSLDTKVVNEVAKSTIAVKSGRYYWEVIPTFTTNYDVVGIGGPGISVWVPGGPSIVWTSSNADMFQVYGWSASNTTITTPYETGDVLGLALDLDNNRLEVFQNGTSRGTTDIDVGDDFVSPIFGNSNATPDHQHDVNYGQRPFRFDPPAGFKPLQTQNLPDAPIPDGSEHFRVLTGPGSADNDPNFNPSTQTPGDWTKDVSCPGGFDPSFPVSNLFDGFNTTNSSVYSNDAEDIITFAPSGGLPFTTSVAVVSNFAFQRARINGSSNDWVDLVQNATTEIFAGSGIIYSIEIQSTSGVTAVTAIQVDGRQLVDMSILAIAQQQDKGFPSGLWWIKSREASDANTTQHMFVDSVRGQVGGKMQKLNCPNINQGDQDYTPPAGDSVAWCWNCPDAFVPVGTNGITNLTGRRNVDAGFSIVTYEGSTTDASTYTHGLNATPEFIITKTRTAASEGWAVWETSLGTGNLLRLHSNAQKGANSSVWQGVDENVITVGDNTIVNGTGETYISYIWHSVPGYSAIGSYDGNNDSNGVFVYTGFRPAFIMFKAIDGTGEWVVYDTTRNIYNPVDARLCPNNINGERTSTGMQVDFLSNGFKHYNAEVDLNNDFTYLYVAFAERPFAGNNVAPSNAR